MPASVASDKYLYWHEVMERFQKSGLSGMQFCRQEDLKYTAFADWRQRLRKDVQRKAPKYRQVQDWEAVIEKARSNPGGIQQYCDEHGISKKTFYKRFREIKVRHPEWGRLSSWSSGRKRKTQAANGSRTPKQPAKSRNNVISEESFVPVQVIETAMEKQAAIEVILPNSITLRIVPGCSIEFLQTITSALGGA